MKQNRIVRKASKNRPDKSPHDTIKGEKKKTKSDKYGKKKTKERLQRGEKKKGDREEKKTY